MPTLQPLSQHEGILCADGDDQAGTREQAGGNGGDPHQEGPGSEGTRRVRPLPCLDNLIFLYPVQEN